MNRLPLLVLGGCYSLRSAFFIVRRCAHPDKISRAPSLNGAMRRSFRSVALVSNSRTAAQIADRSWAMKGIDRFWVHPFFNAAA